MEHSYGIGHRAENADLRLIAGVRAADIRREQKFKLHQRLLVNRYTLQAILKLSTKLEMSPLALTWIRHFVNNFLSLLIDNFVFRMKFEKNPT